MSEDVAATGSAESESPQLRAFREGVAQFLAAFNEGDFERAFAGATDDFETHFAPGTVWPEIKGREEAIAFYSEFREDIDGWHIEPNEYLELGPLTFLLGFEGTGFGRSSGLDATVQIWDVVEIDERGRYRSSRQFFDRDEALAAAREGGS